MSIDQWLADPSGMRELRRDEHDLMQLVTWHLVLDEPHASGRNPPDCKRCDDLARATRAVCVRREAAEALARLVEVYGVTS